MVTRGELFFGSVRITETTPFFSSKFPHWIFSIRNSQCVSTIFKADLYAKGLPSEINQIAYIYEIQHIQAPLVKSVNLHQKASICIAVKL